MKNIVNNIKSEDRPPLDAQQQEYMRIMLDFLTGKGPSELELFITLLAKLVVTLPIIFINIYIYYFVYHFSFNENFLLIFFFFGFFCIIYNYIYFNILNSLDSLSLELYIQFYRLIKVAKTQLIELRNRLEDFKFMNRGLFLTYRNFVYLHVSTINTLESLSQFFYSSLINSLLEKLNDYQFQATKRSLSELTRANGSKWSRDLSKIKKVSEKNSSSGGFIKKYISVKIRAEQRRRWREGAGLRRRERIFFKKGI
jgi:hypothetical protein